MAVPVSRRSGYESLPAKVSFTRRRLLHAVGHERVLTNGSLARGPALHGQMAKRFPLFAGFITIDLLIGPAAAVKVMGLACAPRGGNGIWKRSVWVAINDLAPVLSERHSCPACGTADADSRIDAAPLLGARGLCSWMVLRFAVSAADHHQTLVIDAVPGPRQQQAHGARGCNSAAANGGAAEPAT